MAKELIAADAKLAEAGDVAALRRAATKYTLATAQVWRASLDGWEGAPRRARSRHEVKEGTTI